MDKVREAMKKQARELGRSNAMNCESAWNAMKAGDSKSENEYRERAANDWDKFKVLYHIADEVSKRFLNEVIDAFNEGFNEPEAVQGEAA